MPNLCVGISLGPGKHGIGTQAQPRQRGGTRCGEHLVRQTAQPGLPWRSGRGGAATSPGGFCVEVQKRRKTTRGMSTMRGSVTVPSIPMLDDGDVARIIQMLETIRSGVGSDRAVLYFGNPPRSDSWRPLSTVQASSTVRPDTHCRFPLEGRAQRPSYATQLQQREATSGWIQGIGGHDCA